MPKPSNASISVETSSSVMMSIFLDGASPQEASPILLKNYNSKSLALELVVLGDFQALLGSIADCGHFIKAGDNPGDCMPETFSLKEYEKMMNMQGYGWNYIYKDKGWYGVRPNKNSDTPTYIKLKRKKHGSKKESSSKKG